MWSVAKCINSSITGPLTCYHVCPCVSSCPYMNISHDPTSQHVLNALMVMFRDISNAQGRHGKNRVYTPLFFLVGVSQKMTSKTLVVHHHQLLTWPTERYPSEVSTLAQCIRADKPAVYCTDKPVVYCSDSSRAPAWFFTLVFPLDRRPCFLSNSVAFTGHSGIAMAAREAALPSLGFRSERRVGACKANTGL